jgi:hypothetical protein
MRELGILSFVIVIPAQAGISISANELQKRFLPSQE